MKLNISILIYFAYMLKLLVLGAGRSSSSLISYLLRHSKAHPWEVIVGDVSIEAAEARVDNHPHGRAIKFDVQDVKSMEVITEASVVISLLPAHLHIIVARQCLTLDKHLLTASYISDEMLKLDKVARDRNLLFLNECGLDPGIDHMSAMQIIDRIKAKGGRLTSFESFTGGLIAPDTDPENPWRYKFTWNPRNVVMAGQGTAKYLQDGNYKYISYPQLFSRVTPVTVPGHGEYEGYANRDSLKYIETYHLQNINTMLRGTLRNAGYCSAWNVFVQLGCCDDSYELDGVSTMTHASFIGSFLPEGRGRIEETLQSHLGLDENVMHRLRWSGLFSDELVGLQKGTPAQVLEYILNKKWKLNPSDKDQIVMWHRFYYELNGKSHEIQSSLVVTGTDSTETAMAKTVGLPLAMAAKLLVEGKMNTRGVVIPTMREIYDPVLAELSQSGIEFREVERVVQF